MKISLNMPEDAMNLSSGYGLAGFRIVLALQELGHKVPYKDETAPVEIAFCQPDQFEWSNPDAYHIGYTPWESTGIPAEWSYGLNHCDEFWTTSGFSKKLFEKSGYTVNRVFHHGVNADIWQKRRRQRRDVLKFLHIGEPAVRKGGQMTLDAFREAFGDRTDVHLTIKAQHMLTARGREGKWPSDAYNNVSVITADLLESEVVKLFNDHDVLVYPSYGEGFGFIPLQGLVSGMPTICTASWAPYRRQLHPDLALGYHWQPSPDPILHPGMVTMPNYNDLVTTLLLVDEHFEDYAADAFSKAGRVAKYYNWVKLTEKAFSPVFEKVGGSIIEATQKMKE